MNRKEIYELEELESQDMDINIKRHLESELYSLYYNKLNLMLRL